MPLSSIPARRLGDAEISSFTTAGFVVVEGAFPASLAATMRATLWRATGCDPDDPATWTRPVVRIGYLAGDDFAAAANTPVLHAAFDRLVGPGRWQRCGGLGTFPIRFPSREDPGDTGWHVDMSFGTEDPDFMSWRVNVASCGRALLMLFLISDVGPDDAPTRIRVGSHRDVARCLAPAGEAGRTLRELVDLDFGGASRRPEAIATGPAGTVYLCHPFLVHAAQPHRGRRPRFLAQPPLLPACRLRIDDAAADPWPVERAIREALTTRD